MRPSLHQLPSLAGGSVAPIHTPLPPAAGNANLHALRWIARQTGGAASAPLADAPAVAAAVSGADAALTLTRLATDLEADLDAATDDSFQATARTRTPAAHHPTTPPPSR